MSAAADPCRALRESEAKYRAIFDLANDAMFLHDAGTGAILDVNQKMAEMYGWSRDEVLQMAVADLSAGKAPYTQKRALELLRAASAGSPQLFEWLAKHRSGRLFWVEVNLKQIDIGSAPRLLAIVRDITDRKAAEDQLRAADEQLREQAALVRLGEMAAVVAHEIKNPLAGARGVIQVLGRRLPPDTADAGIIAEVLSRLDALNDLMGDLLLFARPPHPQPSPTEIVALAKEAAHFLAQDPAVQDVRIDVDGSAVTVLADPKLLRIVLLNLLLNAAHAVQSGGGAVRISVAPVDGLCRIAIADTGAGIPSDVLPRIFVPFFTTKARGTGLGLPTAKRLVEAHGGRITVECPPPRGTIVTIELPR